MTQVILPNTFSPNTVIESAKVMANQTALRDVINGQLEGGPTVDGNIKANGVTAREIADVVLPHGISDGLQAGVVGASDGKVTPAAGLALNYGAGTIWVTDSGSVIGGASGLVPATISGGSVTVGANASGNPRIDQVIATLTGWGTATISVLQGVATVGATLDNRVGAAALPASSIRLADILVPNAFAGPFLQATHIRDRRPWARGLSASMFDSTSGIVAVSSTVYGNGLLSPTPRVEVSGNPVLIEAIAVVSSTPATSHVTSIGLILDNNTGNASRDLILTTPAGASTFFMTASWVLSPAEFPAGSHQINLGMAVTASSSSLNRSTLRPFGMYARELVLQDQYNDGA